MLNGAADARLHSLCQEHASLKETDWQDSLKTEAPKHQTTAIQQERQKQKRPPDGSALRQLCLGAVVWSRAELAMP